MERMLDLYLVKKMVKMMVHKTGIQMVEMKVRVMVVSWAAKTGLNLENVTVALWDIQMGLMMVKTMEVP